MKVYGCRYSEPEDPNEAPSLAPDEETALRSIQEAHHDLLVKTLAGSFRIVGVLERARELVTLQGVDIDTGRDVVLTAAPVSLVTPGIRTRLAHEVTALRGAASPQLAAMTSVDEADEMLYTVRPFVSGETLARALQRGPLPIDGAIALARDFMLGLQAMHDCGVLHRELDPESVIITDAEGAHGVLSYTGLSRPSRLALAGALGIEAAYYASPEEAGLLNRAVDERSDLYSAGAVLFQSLCGFPPFDGQTVNEVLRRHVVASEPSLRKIRPEIPPELEEVVRRMLRTEAGDRYPSATAVAFDLTRLLAAVKRGARHGIGADPRKARATELSEPAFIGREGELEALSVKLDEARHGHGSLITLEAESGAGVSRLLDEIADRSTREDAWVLRGRGRERAAPDPYELLAGVSEAIVGRVATDAAFAERLRERLSGHEESIAETMPELSVALGYAVAVPVQAENPGQIRSERALDLLLSSLGSAEEPAVVLLDDCHWGDELALSLLAEWPAHEDSVIDDVHVLVVAAFHSEDVGPSHHLRAVRGAGKIVLAALDAGEVEKLAGSMASKLPAEASELVQRLSGGSPFMATELVRGLVETGALTAEVGGWRVDPERMAEAQSSQRAARVIGKRFDQLPRHVLDLLSTGAVLGKQFALEPARELARQSPADAEAALREAGGRYIVWFDADVGQWAFIHNRVREALLARLSDSARRSLHLRAALSLETSDSSRTFELAFHFDAAGEFSRALPYALQAAATARGRYSLETAERYYRIAERGADPNDASTTRKVCEGLGEVAMLQGRYSEAAVHLAAADLACRDDVARAQIQGKIGELAFKRGEAATAKATLEGALRLLGVRVPRTFAGFLRAFLVQAVVQVLHTLAPRLFVGRRKLAGADRELLAARLLSQLAYAHWFSAGAIPCAWAHLRGLNLVERYPPSTELAQAYSEHGPAMTMIPYFKRGLAYTQRSLEIRAELGDVRGVGQSEHFRGVVLYSASRFEEALESCRAALDKLERAGDLWEAGTAKWHVAFSLYRLGRMDEAIEVSRELHQNATSLGNVQAAGISVGAWAKAARGDIPSDLIRSALATLSGDVHATAEVLQAEALHLLAAGEPAKAVASLEHAHELVRRSRLRQEYVAPILPWLATALRRQLAVTTELAPRERRRLARRARRVAGRARRMSRSYQNNLPHALREQGLLAAAAGRPGRARRRLDQSLKIAEQQGASDEYARTLLARGEVGVAHGWPEGPTELARARWLLDPSAADQAAHGEHEPTLSLADRFATLLDTGRSIASALTRAAVFEAVHDAAIRLLRAQQCTVFTVAEGEDGPILQPVAGAAEHDDARAAVASALRIGRPVVTETELDGAGEYASSESTLCAIVLVRGHAEACIHVNHSVVGGLFGEEEERLAAYIATLAGAALENAQGFLEAQELSRSLELRVHERTAELSTSKEQAENALSLLTATLESTTDGILVVDPGGRIVSHNQRFADMWRMPPEILGSMDDERVIQSAAGQLAEPDRFVAKIRELYADPDAESQDLLEFPDGRVFERFSRPQRIAGASVGRVWSFRDVTLQKRSERELEHLANHDGLTGLMNRRRFEQELERRVGHIARYGGRTAAMILDIDNFKYVNDTLGHAAGDELIRSVANLLSSRLRGSDVVARLGGDEFAVLLIEADADAAQRVAIEVLTAIRHHIVIVRGRRISMTASIGVALLEDGVTEANQLLADADLAMYEAKRDGRDGVAIYDAVRAREARLEARYSWAERLREALENDRFELHAQPILDLATDEISHHEALLRLDDTDGTLVAAAEFLPTAERLGIAPAIDRWVVTHAIREVGSWTGEGANQSLEINLSGASIGDPELATLIQAEIEAAGIEPSRLIFEVTETAAIANMDEAKRFTATLRALGCRFALDDFGTGFGSFYYLKHLAVDFLKVDGDFVSDLHESDVDGLVVSSIVDMARGMGKKTIAECIADSPTLEQLRAYGIDYAQGFHVGHPRPLAELTRRWIDGAAE